MGKVIEAATGGLIKEKKERPKPVVLPEETRPEKIDESAALAAEEEKRKRRREGGRASTILTSPLGVTGSANIATKTLLGS